MFYVIPMVMGLSCMRVVDAVTSMLNQCTECCGKKWLSVQTCKSNPCIVVLFVDIMATGKVMLLLVW